MVRLSSGFAISLVLIACLALCVATLTYPSYIVQPYRLQSATELTVALAVLRYRVLADSLLAILAIAAVIWYWRKESHAGKRCAAIATALAVCSAAALSRVNKYEQMFHPIERLSFSRAAKSKLPANAKVMAVKIGSTARAYPVRNMAYHHIANDMVDGVPIAATY